MQMTDMCQLFPNFKYVLSTRHPLNLLKSSSRMISPFFDSLYYRLGFHWRDKAASNFALSYDPKHTNKIANSYSRWRNSERKEVVGVMLYTSALLAFSDNR